MADDPVLVKFLLSQEPSWNSLHIGFYAVNLFFTRLTMNLYNGMDVEQCRAQFHDSVTRASAAILEMNRDALARVLLEAYQDNPRSEALDNVPTDDFKTMVDNLVEEIKELRKVKDDE